MKLEIEDILEILPHSYPFVLVDRVTEMEPAKSAKGLKNITMNEPYFQGHFEKRPIYPGVLIIESLAQLAALMYCSGILEELSEEDKKDISSHVGYLAGVQNFRFYETVRPGDQLILAVEKTEELGMISKIQCKASCDGKKVASGVITVSQK